MSNCDRIHRKAATTGAVTEANEADHPVRHLTQAELAKRWRKSERTLERWRLRGIGPPHLWIGGVLYRIEDIEAFEQMHLQHKATRRSKSRRESTTDEAP